MNNNKLLRTTTVLLAQIIFFIVAQGTVEYIAEKQGLIRTHSVGWGISVMLYFMVYISLAGISYILIQLFPSRALLTTTIAVALFISLLFRHLDELPYRAVVFMLIGIIGFSMQYFYQRSRGH